MWFGCKIKSLSLSQPIWLVLWNVVLWPPNVVGRYFLLRREWIYAAVVIALPFKLTNYGYGILFPFGIVLLEKSWFLPQIWLWKAIVNAKRGRLWLIAMDWCIHAIVYGLCKSYCNFTQQIQIDFYSPTFYWAFQKTINVNLNIMKFVESFQANWVKSDQNNFNLK